MKAVIMAGGKGTRLRPLTWRVPKPMVPLLDKPCMEYSIELLKRHGITDIAVTLQYLPHAIREYFGDGTEWGVRLHYFEETNPLGTAGGVKNAAAVLDETFIVISGDALTDFDLGAALAFHRTKGALATVVLSRRDVVREYGVVLTRDDGQIQRFVEKPSWSEVFSDTVNTGIYVFEPEILQTIPAGTEFDFSKDLFPQLLARQAPLYGYIASGYWSDIGNLEQYRQAQFDLLDGRADLPLAGHELNPGIRVGKHVEIDSTAALTGPVYIGDGAVIESGAQIGPYTVLGRNTRVSARAEVACSIVWHGSYIGAGAVVEGVTLASGVKAGAGTHIHADAVIGDHTDIGEKAVIQPGVKVWPHKRIGRGAQVQSSVIWTGAQQAEVFARDGIRGVPNADLTPEFATRVAAAFASSLGSGKVVSVSSDGACEGDMLKHAVIAGLLSAGAAVRDVGTLLAPLARFECRHHADGAVHLRRASGGDGQEFVMQFFDHDGLPIDRSLERKIENALHQEDFSRADGVWLGAAGAAGVIDAYTNAVVQKLGCDDIRRRRPLIVAIPHHPQAQKVMHRLLQTLGCQIITVYDERASVANIVTASGADLGVVIDESGERLRLFTGRGREVSEAELAVLYALIACHLQVPIAVPVTAPAAAEHLILPVHPPLVRTKASPRAVLEVGKGQPVQLSFDAFFTTVSLIDFLVREEVSLDDVIARLPAWYRSQAQVPCPLEATGRVMRRLLESMQGKRLELTDGIKVITDEGWALILPDPEAAAFQVIAEGRSEQTAQDLSARYRDTISSLLQG